MTDVTKEEYQKLSDLYAENAPTLSGCPGMLTRLRETQLVNELLEPDFARAVNAQAAALAVPQSVIIQKALSGQLSVA